MWLSFLTAAVGSFFGSVGGFLSALQIARRAERHNTTTNLMNEYLSSSFIAHRDSIFEVRRRVEAGEVDIADIASGFWFPGQPDSYYVGNTSATLTDHQHLTVYIGFIVRLADSIRRRRVDLATIRNQLGAVKLNGKSAFGRAGGSIRFAERNGCRKSARGQAAGAMVTWWPRAWSWRTRSRVLRVVLRWRWCQSAPSSW